MKPLKMLSSLWVFWGCRKAKRAMSHRDRTRSDTGCPLCPKRDLLSLKGEQGGGEGSHFKSHRAISMIFRYGCHSKSCKKPLRICVHLTLLNAVVKRERLILLAMDQTIAMMKDATVLQSLKLDEDFGKSPSHQSHYSLQTSSHLWGDSCSADSLLA